VGQQGLDRTAELQDSALWNGAARGAGVDAEVT